MNYEERLNENAPDRWIPNITTSAIGFSKQDPTADGPHIQDKANASRINGPYILLICGNGQKIYQLGPDSFSESNDNITKVDNHISYDFKCTNSTYGESAGHSNMHLLSIGDPFGVHKNIIYAHYRNVYKEHVRVGSSYYPDPTFYTRPIDCPCDFHEAWRYLDLPGINDQRGWPGVGPLQARQSRDCC